MLSEDDAAAEWRRRVDTCGGEGETTAKANIRASEDMDLKLDRLCGEGGRESRGRGGGI